MRFFARFALRWLSAVSSLWFLVRRFFCPDVRGFINFLPGLELARERLQPLSPTILAAQRPAMKASSRMRSRGLMVPVVVLLLSSMAAMVNAIYPGDHWTYSKKLTEDNFESTIQAEIDAGRTMFVRWIASSG
jgi:hypothetical protein